MREQLSDRLLGNEVAQGNVTAFKQLFGRYYPVVVKVLLQYSSDQEVIQKWVIDINRELWRARKELKNIPGGSFRSYFILTARNQALKNQPRPALRPSLYDWRANNSGNSPHVSQASDVAVFRRLSESAGTPVSNFAVDRMRLAIQGHDLQKSLTGMANSLRTFEFYVTRLLSAFRQGVSLRLR